MGAVHLDTVEPRLGDIAGAGSERGDELVDLALAHRQRLLVVVGVRQPRGAPDRMPVERERAGVLYPRGEELDEERRPMPVNRLGELGPRRDRIGGEGADGVDEATLHCRMDGVLLRHLKADPARGPRLVVGDMPRAEMAVDAVQERHRGGRDAVLERRRPELDRLEQWGEIGSQLRLRSSVWRAERLPRKHWHGAAEAAHDGHALEVWDANYVTPFRDRAEREEFRESPRADRVGRPLCVRGQASLTPLLKPT